MIPMTEPQKRFMRKSLAMQGRWGSRALNGVEAAKVLRGKVAIKSDKPTPMKSNWTHSIKKAKGVSLQAMTPEKRAMVEAQTKALVAKLAEREILRAKLFAELAKPLVV